MRREGFELQVGQPQVIIREIDGKKCEPVEMLTINVPEDYSSKIIDMVTRRKGEMVSMTTQNDRLHIEFIIPSRGIIGLRNNVLTASAGEAIMAHRFHEYQPWKGDIERRTNGSLIAMEGGTAYAYAIDKLQDRGRFFIFPQEEVYAGQVVGENAKDNDIVVNVTKSKKLTNMRASGADDKARIIPPVVFSLEEALEYIKEDEYVEVTPHHLRIRKIITGSARDLQKFLSGSGIRHAIGHDLCQIPGRGGVRPAAVVDHRVQAVWRDKISIEAADIPRFLVHHRREAFHAAAHRLRDHHRRIIVRLQHQRIQKIL